MSSEHDDDEVRPNGGVHEADGTGAGDDVLVGGTAGGHGLRESPPGRRRLTVALVAAAVLVAAGGGAYWAVSSGPSDRGAKPGTAQADSRTAVPGGAVAVPGVGTADYRLTGTLPDGPDSAPLYHPSGAVGQAEVRRLAAVLGVTGPVVADHGSWRVGPGDGTGPALLVDQSGPGIWSYARNATVTPGATAVPPRADGGSTAHRADGSGTATAGPQVARPADGGADAGATSHQAAGSGTVTGTRQVPPQADGTASAHRTVGTITGSPPSELQAKGAASPVLGALGLSAARVGATKAVGPSRTVTADPVVGGLPTHGWETSLDIDPNGRIISGHGRLSTLAKGRSYPVVSADQAFRNLAPVQGMQPDHRPSCQVPMPDGKDGAQAGEPARPGGNAAGFAATSPPAVTSPTVPGQDKALPQSLPCVRPPARPIDITGAEFGLATQFVPGGQALVPAWLFEAKPEGTTTTSVVAEQAVDQADLQGTQSSVTPAPPTTTAVPVNPPATGGSHLVTVSRYQLHGTVLTLTFMGGVCETYSASASESADRVLVTVTGEAKKPGAVCPALMKAQTASVTLDHPLAGRTVVDAVSGAVVKGS